MKCIYKKEYAIGDFVKLTREIEIKPHAYNIYDHIGVIVKKELKSKSERTIYWFKEDYNYLISVPEYDGDYIWSNEDDIDGEINPPIEYKLHMICNFGEWWYPQHKSIYQKMLIDALN